MSKTAKLIRINRSEQGYSQTQLQRMVWSELNSKTGQFVSNIERGLCGIPENKVCKMAKALKISPMEIMQEMTEDYYAHLYTVCINNVELNDYADTF